MLDADVAMGMFASVRVVLSPIRIWLCSFPRSCAWETVPFGVCMGKSAVPIHFRWESPSPPVPEVLSVSTESGVGGVTVSLIGPLAPIPRVSGLLSRLSSRVGAVGLDLDGVETVSDFFTLFLPSPRLC